ncbi:phospholipase A [Novosphingobium sp.]|uniref:phospholipase A n=1 Tax=Novosphingobium sp. TaxID=1874826 RepID=UPI002FE16795
MRILVSTGSAFLCCALPAAAHAQTCVEVLIGHFFQDGPAHTAVELRLLNPTNLEAEMVLPDRIEARTDANEGERTIVLERAPETPPHMNISAVSFAQARYRSARNELQPGRLLSIPAWSTPAVRIAIASSAPPAAENPATMSAPSSRQPAAPPTDRTAGNAFAKNLSPYEPTYAVYGPGTNSEARIQLSFKYRLFGTVAQKTSSWRDGVYFAYTQRMFWDLGANSSPFRNIDFQPELIYIAPSVTLNSGVSLSAQAGIRHESNGRDGPQSRSINSIYAGPMAALPLDGDYSLTIAPRLSVYFGDKSDNPDIARYRGHASLFMEIGATEGLRLSTSTRFNFDTGKGAINGDISYPLPRLLGGGPDLYLFAQSFYGYGENLLDYNRRSSRFRIGFALVR